MLRIFVTFLFILVTPIVTYGATSRTGLRTTTTTARAATATPNAAYNYNYMYPYMNNQMRTDLNPGVTPEQGSNPINVITRTESLGAPRRVVARPQSGTQSTARSAASTTTQFAARNASASTSGTNGLARAATPSPTTTYNANTSARRVVARSATPTAQRATTARSSRGDASYYTNAADAAAQIHNYSGETLPSARCLADYTECMNGYCVRDKTAYNRCYCSSRLSQIDSTYKPAIDNLIRQILQMQSTNAWSQEEMNEYWMNTIGKYTGDNSWVNLDNALNINWADTESRVRGQQAFATGHEYCMQHLRGCNYMATNIRDAYRSEIARDCAAYEAGLDKIKNAAESIVEAYSD